LDEPFTETYSAGCPSAAFITALDTQEVTVRQRNAQKNIEKLLTNAVSLKHDEHPELKCIIETIALGIDDINIVMLFQRMIEQVTIVRIHSTWRNDRHFPIARKI